MEAIKILNLTEKTKFYQASTSELYGAIKESPQNENTPFLPTKSICSGKTICTLDYDKLQRAYGIFACNGILFNHESPRRGETFVTRKITRGLCRIDQGLEKCLYMGNLDSLRDWGHAKDYVEMQWLILQQEKPEDYVIASGRQESVRNFIELCARELGWNTSSSQQAIKWEGDGTNEIGRRVDNGEVVIKIDSRYFRPCEVDSLLGDASKAEKKLGWKPKISLKI